MSRTPKKKEATATVRCAVYTRKSTDEGLEQEFNTLDAQRESGEAYIASQKNEGWQCMSEHYDDGGFSGGNMDRPALERLLADITAGKVDCVVVYKVDRLSRSLLDFAKIMEVFDQQHVAFVSVTQQFNTSTPMGRLRPAHGPAKDLSRAAYHVRRAEQAGMVQKIGWVGEWVAIFARSLGVSLPPAVSDYEPPRRVMGFVTPHNPGQGCEIRVSGYGLVGHSRGKSPSLG